MKPEYKCPECGSVDLTVIWMSRITYDQQESGDRLVASTEDEALDSIECKSCGEESDGDDVETWKNKEA